METYKEYKRGGLSTKDTYEEELIELIDKYEWDVFGTLTFWVEPTEQQAIKCLRHYWNMLDRAYFKNATKRYGHRIQRMNFLHKKALRGESGEKIHFHFVAKAPTRKLGEFKRRLQQHWRQEFYESGYINEIKDTIPGEESKIRLRNYLLHEYSTLKEKTFVAETVVLYEGDEYRQITKNHNRNYCFRDYRIRKNPLQTHNTSTKKAHKYTKANNNKKQAIEQAPVKIYTQAELKQYELQLQAT